MTVYLLEHLMIYMDHEDVKFIGVFSSRENAVKAIKELINKPGFRDAKKILNPLIDGNISGFIIDKCEIDKVAWKEGFG